MSKHLHCPKCARRYHYRIPTPGLLRAVLFFLPIQSFFCAKCLTTRYELITERELTEYEI